MMLVKLAAMAVIATSPFSLTLSPAKMAAMPGSVTAVTVWDSGKTTLPVTVNLAEIKRIGNACRKVPGNPAWAQVVGRAHFMLAPGKRRVVRVRVGDTGKAGAHDLAITATTALGHRGNVLVDGAVAAQALVIFPGHVAPNAPKPCVSLSAPSGHGFSVATLLIAVAGTVAAIAMCALAYWRGFRHRGTHRARIK